jgi:6-pyruvoyltetrahydropterin/6-carboxytetrahydropterin synthase
MTKPEKTTTISCTRRIEFDAAHRVMEHESKCKHLHGHRYAVEASFVAEEGLDTLGRVIDFGVIKEKLGAWIDENWDHTTILYMKDKPLGDSIAGHTKQMIYYMPTNPTAENMAIYLKDAICPKLFTGTGVTCLKIKIFETPNCAAEAF